MTLLACDLDGTLLGDKASLRKLMENLEGLRSSGKLRLVYATGRSLESFKSINSSEGLTKPDALISSVGTEIYIDPNNIPLPQWQDTFKNGWERNTIRDLCLASTRLILQPEIAQNPYRIAFVSNSSQSSDLETLRIKLSKEFPEVDLIVSHNTEFIDVVPKGSDKGSALKFLASHWGIDIENVICAGDSNNDLPLLRVAKAIIVGNAFKELKDKLPENDKVYYASRFFAAGVEEGLDNYLGGNWGVL